MDLEAQFAALTSGKPTAGSVVNPSDATVQPEPAVDLDYDATDLEAEIRRTDIALARVNLAEFVKQAWHVQHPSEPLIWNWHLETICDHVQWMYEELARARRDFSYTMRAKNLVINLPPRSLKSYIVSVYAPAWAWIRWPDLKLRATSGNPDNVLRDARYSKYLIEHEWYGSSFGHDFKWEVDAATHFQNQVLGERRSKGLLAKHTGQGADVIIVDDPHDAQQALSDVQRERAVEIWSKSLESRVENENRCIRILIMQRLHELDLSGVVLNQNKAIAETIRGEHPEWTADQVRDEMYLRGGWVHLMLPLEYEPQRANPPTIIGWVDPRIDAGELLSPEQWGSRFVANKKVALGTYGYAGQMQQNPAPLEGGIFKRRWWAWHRPDGKPAHGPHPRPMGCLTREESPAVVLPKFFEYVISVDAAFKDLEKNSRVSITVWAPKGADRYLVANNTAHMSFTKTIAAVKAMKALYPRAFRIYIEDKANGSAIVDTLRKQVQGVIAVNPEGGKESRASAISAFVEAGNVYLPDGMAWIADFVHEMGVFPNGEFDDQVDSASQALNKMKGGSTLGRAAMLSKL